MRTKIHRLGAATKPIAFRLFRFGLFAGVLSFIIGIIATGVGRTWAMRSVAIFFATALSVTVVHYTFIAADEWLAGRYGTAVWMLFWVGLLSFMFYLGLRFAIVVF